MLLDTECSQLRLTSIQTEVQASRFYTEGADSFTDVLQAGNFLDKIVTFCVGMGIGKGLASCHDPTA